MPERQSDTVRHVDVGELEAAMRRGGPPTDDDVTILADGTRLDTPEKVRAWIAEIVAMRSADSAR